jgi:hypothetical protein
LALHVRATDEVRKIGAGLVAADVRTVASVNPYWNRWGQTFLDPDGYRIVIAAAESSDIDPRAVRGDIRPARHRYRLAR